MAACESGRAGLGRWAVQAVQAVEEAGEAVAVAMMTEDLVVVLVVLETSTRKAKSVSRARYHARYSVPQCAIREPHDAN